MSNTIYAAFTGYRLKESLDTELNTVCNPESVNTAAWTLL